MTRVEARKSGLEAKILNDVLCCLQLESLDPSNMKCLLESATERKRSLLNVTTFNHFDDSIILICSDTQTFMNQK